MNILICTHNDADHVGAVIGFLESSPSCDELWLPAKWIQVLASLPENLTETTYFLSEYFLTLAHRYSELVLDNEERR